MELQSFPLQCLLSLFVVLFLLLKAFLTRSKLKQKAANFNSVNIQVKMVTLLYDK